MSDLVLNLLLLACMVPGALAGLSIFLDDNEGTGE